MQVHTLEENVVLVIVVEPWLVHSGRPWIVVVQYGCISLFSEDTLSLHALDDLLGAIAVMDVEVNDGNFVDLVSVCALEVSSGDSHVVDIAEPVRVFLVAYVVFER